MGYSSLTNVVVPANANNYTSRRRNKICKFTPHHMAGNLSAERCGQVFQSPGRQASSNYGIGSDGRIGGYVPEESRAWTSSNSNNDHQAITVEVANDQIGGNWHVSDAAFNSLVKLAVDVCRRYGFRLVFTGDASGSLTYHQMFASTSCPGPYLKSKMQELANLVNAQLDGNSASTPTIIVGGSTGTYNVVRGDSLSVIGQKLGVNWNDIATLNGIVKPYTIYTGQVLKVPGGSNTQATVSKKSVEEVAKEVINGHWGVGEDRANRLQSAGYNYTEVQNKVNEILLGKPAKPVQSAPAKKSVSDIAREVINGAWGNGEDRANRLKAAGYNYNEVQNEVNAIIGGKPAKSPAKSIDTIAREVIAGKWGNGSDRSNRLKAAGYNYTEVQNRVNQLLK